MSRSVVLVVEPPGLIGDGNSDSHWQCNETRSEGRYTAMKVNCATAEA